MPDHPQSSNSDPGVGREHYSVDEMMERLRQGGEGHRRRRRRSHQPAVMARKRRRRWVVISGGILAALFLAGLCFHLYNRMRVSGETFRANANRRFSGMLGTNVEWNRFSPRGWHDLDCPEVQITGHGGSFKLANLSAMRANLAASAFFQNEWEVENLEVERANIVFQAPDAGAKAQEDFAISLAAPVPQNSFRIGLSGEPSFVTVQAFRVGTLSASWPGSQGKEVSITNLQASGSMIQQVLQLHASGGTMSGGLFGTVPLESLALKVTGSTVEVQNARLRISEKVECRGVGNIEFTKDGPVTDLRVEITPSQLSEWLRPAWQDRLSGRFTPENCTYRGKPGQPEEFSGNFSVEGLVVMNLPIFPALNQRFNSELYSKLEFRQFTGRFSKTAERLVIDQIEGRRQGEAWLRGSVTLWADGRLEGKLRLALNTIESNSPFFSAEEDGLDVMELNLGGTEKEPRDDLTPRLGGPAQNVQPPQ